MKTAVIAILSMVLAAALLASMPTYATEPEANPRVLFCKPMTPFCLSSCDARRVDILLPAHDDAKNFTRNVAF